MLTKAPRGTKDITPKDAYKWNYVENKFREVCSLFGYEEMRKCKEKRNIEQKFQNSFAAMMGPCSQSCFRWKSPP